ncbi:MAG: hypothetical protein ACHP6I_02790 [Rickettsiales bacterium]
MLYPNISWLSRLATLLSGAFSSCALFVKYGDDVYHFNSQNSIGKDWLTISEDIGVAMYYFEEDDEGTEI